MLNCKRVICAGSCLLVPREHRLDLQSVLPILIHNPGKIRQRWTAPTRCSRLYTTTRRSVGACLPDPDHGTHQPLAHGVKRTPNSL
jgi:hypothetical protein